MSIKEKSGIRAPRYGELVGAANAEVMRIWRSRHEELPLLDPVEFDSVDNIIDIERSVIEKDIIKKYLDNAKSFLTKREAYVIDMRFRCELTMEEVGVSLEITKERVRQIEAKALRKMRHPRSLSTTNMDINFRVHGNEKVINTPKTDESSYPSLARNFPFSLNEPSKFFSVFSFNLSELGSQLLATHVETRFKDRFVKEFSHDMLKLQTIKRYGTYYQNIFVTCKDAFTDTCADELLEKILMEERVNFKRKKK